MTGSAFPGSAGAKCPVEFHAEAEQLLRCAVSFRSMWGFERDMSFEQCLDRIAISTQIGASTDVTSGPGDGEFADIMKEVLDGFVGRKLDNLPGVNDLPSRGVYRRIPVKYENGDVECCMWAIVCDEDDSAMGVNLEAPAVGCKILACAEGIGADGIGMLCQAVCLYCNAVGAFGDPQSIPSSFVSNFAVLVSALRDKQATYTESDSEDACNGSNDGECQHDDAAWDLLVRFFSDEALFELVKSTLDLEYEISKAKDSVHLAAEAIAKTVLDVALHSVNDCLDVFEERRRELIWDLGKAHLQVLDSVFCYEDSGLEANEANQKSADCFAAKRAVISNMLKNLGADESRIFEHLRNLDSVERDAGENVGGVHETSPNACDGDTSSLGEGGGGKSQLGDISGSSAAASEEVESDGQD